MQILFQKKVNRSDVEKAMIDEIKAGFGHEAATEQFRIDAVKQEVADLKELPTHPVLGKPVAVLPARDYFRILKKYGHDAFGDKGFLRDLQKHVPETKVHSI